MGRVPFPALRGVRWLVALAVVCGLLGAMATIGMMALVSAIVSRVFLGGAGRPALWIPLLLLLGVIAMRAVCVWMQEYTAQSAATRYKRTLRATLFAQLLRLGPAYTSSARTGEITALATDGIDRLEPYVARYLPQRALSLLVPLLIAAAVWTHDWVSAVILLVTAPILPLLMVLVGSYAQRHIERQWSALARMNAYFLDTLQGLPALTLFGRSAAEQRRMVVVSTAFADLTMKVLRYAFLSALVLEFLTAGAIAVIAVELGTRLIDGGISFERAFFILLLAPEYFRPLRELGTARHAAMEGKPVLERLAQVLKQPVIDPLAGPARGSLSAAAPTLTLRGVTFRYPESTADALSGIDLELPAGVRTAIVGRSGAGKSTMVNLLLRFLEPTAGEILVGGVPLHTLPAARWREYVALVPQRPYLFAGSVYENISFGRHGATRREVERAAALAGLAEAIEHLSQGYETQVGERGSMISGGELQRLAIARAFLKDAPLLILDEPTSSLDPTTEALIRGALERLMHGRTTLIIAHRLNTVYTAERIAVLDQGRVVEVGQHGTLLQQQSLYSALVGAGTERHR